MLCVQSGLTEVSQVTDVPTQEFHNNGIASPPEDSSVWEAEVR